MSDLYLFQDPLTVVLLGALALLVVPAAVFLTLRRVANPPYDAGSFRGMYLAWVLVLGGSSVWNLAREVRFSVDEAGADNYLRLALLAGGALVILLIGARYRFSFLSDLRAGVLGIFALLAAWGLASTVWSISPAGTFYKSFEYCTQLGLLALAIALIKRGAGDPESRLRALKSVFDWNWFLLSLSMLVVYAGILIWPEYAIIRGVGLLGFSLQGALPAVSANGVGQLGAILSTVALVRVLHSPGSRRVFVPLLAVSLLTMILAQSRSPILGFLLAVVVVLVASRRFVLLAGVGAVAGAAWASTFSTTIYEFSRRGQTDGTIQTLSGRTIYWGESIRALQDNWLTGFGANVGGRYVLQTALGEEEVSTVHSMWIEVLVDTGVVGLILLAAGIGAAWFWMLRLRPYAMRSRVSGMLWLEAAGVFTILSVRSIFSVPFIWSQTVLTFGVVVIFIAVMRREIVRGRYAGAAAAQPLPATRRRRPSIRG